MTFGELIGGPSIAGLARANGKKLGRSRVEPEIEDAIHRELKTGTKGIRQIATELGVEVSVVQRVKGAIAP